MATTIKIASLACLRTAAVCSSFSFDNEVVDVEHNFLDEIFHIYALKQVRAGNKVKYLRLAIIFALSVFFIIVSC